tara:strand:+ start:140 stop:541 length:402 start_codon:yes stop_codon:yes gene_type:complete
MKEHTKEEHAKEEDTKIMSKGFKNWIISKLIACENNLLTLYPKQKFKNITEYNTDSHGSWGMGEIKIPITESFEFVKAKAIEKKAHLIVRPTGKYWYIKGFNKKKTFQDIKQHIEENLRQKYHPKTKSWLIEY